MEKSNLDKFEGKDITIPDSFNGRIIIQRQFFDYEEEIVYYIENSVLQNITYSGPLQKKV